MTFSVVMTTIDRSPRKNYLGETLSNLKRSGVFSSPKLESFTLVESGSESLEYLYSALEEADVNCIINQPKTRRQPTENVAFALRRGSQSPAPWVIFLEDDIDVCDSFLESVEAWLLEHAANYRVFPLGANYDILRVLAARGKTSWIYPVEQFYGTLAVVMRSEDARSIGAFLEARKDLHTYDLHIAEWARENEIPTFLTPVPSFIQHIGVESFIRPGSTPIVYPAWGGRTWAYQSRMSA